MPIRCSYIADKQMVSNPERQGTMACFLHQSPKFYNKVCLFIGLTFQQLILIFKRGNFVCHYQECTSIYRLLSYSFRSLVKSISLLSIPDSKIVQRFLLKFLIEHLKKILKMKVVFYVCCFFKLRLGYIGYRKALLGLEHQSLKL